MQTRIRVIIILLLVASVVAGSASPRAARASADIPGEQKVHSSGPRALAQSGSGLEVSVCAEAFAAGEGLATPVAGMPLTTGAPPAVALVALAAEPIASLPPPPARLSLARVELAPGARISPRMAATPRLYILESGSVTIFRHGIAELLGVGSSALVQSNTLFAFVNNSSQPTQLLRLSVELPGSGEQPVFDSIPITTVPSASTAPPIVTSLFRGDLIRMPPAPARLFVACATWAPRATEAIAHQHPGPVGVKVLAGTLLVSDGVIPRTLQANGCTLLDSRVHYQTEAGAEPPMVLLFGIIAEGQPLWRQIDAGSPRSPAATAAPPEVRCG